MTTAELLETVKRIKAGSMPQPEMAEIPRELPTAMPEPIAPPESLGPSVARGTSPQPPPQPQMAAPINPQATAIEGELEAMKQPQAPPNLMDRLKGALEGFGRYGGMDPAQAQGMEMQREQIGVQNQRQKQQDLYGRLKQIQDQDRQGTQDARQRGVDEQNAAFQDLQGKGIQSQIDDRGKPKFGNAAGIGIYNEGTGEVTTPAQQEPAARDPKIGTTIETDKGIMQWNSQTQRYDIPAGQKARPVSTAQPDYEWVMRDGKPVKVQKGPGQPGDAPYDEVAARKKDDATEASPYTKERARRIVQSVDELTAKVSPSTVGFAAYLSGVPTTPALDFAGELQTLKSNIVTNELQQMRADSNTGGALGNVSDREGDRLESALGALNQKQGVEQMKAQLTKVKDSIAAWQAEKDKQGVATPPQGGTIDVISMDGTEGTIPAEDWPAAQKEGYKRK